MGSRGVAEQRILKKLNHAHSKKPLMLWRAYEGLILFKMTLKLSTIRPRLLGRASLHSAEEFAGIEDIGRIEGLLDGLVEPE